MSILKKICEVLFLILVNGSLIIGGDINGILQSPHESENLSQKEVRSLIKDSYGYIWVGTQDGLNRFDGYNYTKFSRDPFDTTSLQYDIIDHLFEDDFKGLWIGTRIGIDILDLNNLKIRHIKSLPGIEGSLEKIKGIRAGPDGKIFLGFDNEIFLITVDKLGNPIDSEKVFGSEVDEEILNFKVEDGDIWISKRNKLMRLHIKSKDLTIIHTWDSDLVKQVYPLSGARAIVLDGPSIYIATKNATRKLEAPMPGMDIRSILIDQPSKEIYFGTKDKGLYRANYTETDFRLSQLQKVFVESIDDQIVTIQRLYKSPEPNEDLIWCGTRSHGLFHYSKSKNLFTHLLPILKSQLNFTGSIYSILPEDKITWLGTDHGLFSIESGKANKISLPHTPGYETIIYTITRTHKGDLLIGGNAGLFILGNGNKSAVNSGLKIEGRILAMHQINDGNFWLATTKGIVILGPNYQILELRTTLENEVDSLEIGIVGALHQDSQGRIWVGTVKGLLLYERPNSVGKYFKYDKNDKNGLIDNIVTSIFEDSKGNIWFASPKGISKLISKKDKLIFEHFTQRDGLNNPYVYGIVESSDHKLWVSTNQGVSVFDPIKKSFSNYSAEDGLIYEEFNSGAFAKDRTGRIYFGGIEVLVSINKDIPENKHLPPVVLCDIKIDGISKYLGPNQAEITVDPGSKALSVVVAALDFTNPLKNQYAYRIPSLDDQWISNGTNRVINIFNLPYGKHLIEIKASNNQNLWNDSNPFLLKVNVLTPWYNSKIWYLFLVALLMLAIWGVHEYRVNEKINIERVKSEENERVRKMASQDLHDEFGNSLTRISVLTEIIKNKLKKKEEVSVQTDLDKIAENTNRLYQGTKDFIWSIRMDSDLLFESAIRIKDYADDMMFAQNIHFETVGINEDLKMVNLPQGSSRQIVVIFKEAIANTLKHSQANEALFEVKVLNPQFVELTWKDNGIGIKANEHQQGNGIQNMKSRAKMIGAEIKIETNSGTQITLLIPTNKKNGK